MSVGPAYDPSEVRRLARAGQVIGTGGVQRWLANHDSRLTREPYDVKETLVDVLCCVEDGRWTGSCTLNNGEIADEYICVYEEENWYLKFYIDDDEVVVHVWSCCWDGTVH